MPSRSQEITLGGMVKGNSFGEARAGLETSEAYQKFTSLVKTVPVQTFTESEIWVAGPHLNLMCPGLVSWLSRVIEYSEVWLGIVGIF